MLLGRLSVQTVKQVLYYMMVYYVTEIHVWKLIVTDFWKHLHYNSKQIRYITTIR